MSKCVFTGSFDPLTLGHLDIIKKAAKIFDTVYVAVLNNQFKETMFNMDQREQLAVAAVETLENVKVVAFTGLAVEIAKEMGASAIVRGLRNAADLDYEREMEFVNSSLEKDVETVYLLSDFPGVSSTAVRQIIELKGDLSKVLTDKQIEVVNKILKRGI